MMTMMDWDNDFTVYFIQLYRDETCLWDPRHKDHKHRSKVMEAWQRISEITGKDVAELKRKRDSLMATFRNHTRKKKKSLREGDEIYEPIWFAYAPMEAFLGELYGTNVASMAHVDFESSDTMDQYSDDSYHDESSIVTATDCKPPKTSEPPERPEPSQPPLKRLKTTSSSREEDEQLNARLYYSKNSISPTREDEETDIYTKMIAKRREEEDKQANPRSHSMRNVIYRTTEDECDLYGKIIAKKLRRIPNWERQLLMYKIDGMIINSMEHSFGGTSSAERSANGKRVQQLNSLADC